MNYPVKIVGVVVDVHNITMYKADGDTLVIPQGDPRVRDLVAKLVPAFEEGGPRFYMLEAEDMQDRNHFADAEKKMGGVVRFFKMVKSKAKELLDRFIEPIEPMELGIVAPGEPVHMVDGVPYVVADDSHPAVVKPKLPREEERPLTKSAAAVAEIMANASSSSSPGFSVAPVLGDEETTVLAVLEDNTIIPGCEALAMQAQSVSEGVGTGIGMQNFLRRAGMIKRGHSVEDLLKFIEAGELPLADDGSVLVYKLLRKSGQEGVFVDCHSGNVKQRVGSYVHMDEKLVDPNRSQDCSNGLHVARRDYLRSFGGDVCVLAKLAPEDVIAVPQYDARKLRAKGYHIIAELSAADRDRVKSDKPMEDQVLLGNAIAGNHVGILEYVQITQSKGGGLIITPAENVTEGSPVLDESLSGSSLDHLSNAETNPEACKVDARALALETAKSTGVSGGYADGDSYRQPMHMHEDLPAEPVSELHPVERPAVIEQDVNSGDLRLVSAVVPGNTKRPVQLLVEAFQNADTQTDKLVAAKSLLTYKKQCKKSWTALGVSIDVWEKATELVQKANTQVATMDYVTAHLPKVVPPNDDNHFPISAPKAKKAVKPVKQPAVKAKDKPVAKATKAKVKPMATPTGTPKRSQKEEAAHLLDIYTKNPDFINAKQLVAFKKGTKKGWEAIGVDAALGKKLEARVKV